MIGCINPDFFNAVVIEVGLKHPQTVQFTLELVAQLFAINQGSVSLLGRNFLVNDCAEGAALMGNAVSHTFRKDVSGEG